MNALQWHLVLFGTVRLRGPDGREKLLERKLAALLAVLALDGPTHRSRLVGLLWPETREAAARNNLVQMLRKLRSATGADLVEGGELLCLGPGLEVDALRARDAYTRGAYAELSGFGADVLAGLRYDDCPDLDDWLTAERERWTEWRVGAAREEAAWLEREGRYDEAAARTRVLLELDPLSEDAWRRLMRLHYLCGDRAAALDAYRRCEALLRREFGVDPLPETLSLLSDIERGRLPSPAAPRTLPLATLRPPTLVGREAEWARMEAAWQAGQVIFVCGEPGMGKTRLARDFAASKGAVLFLEGRPGDVGQPFATAARNVRAHLAHDPHVRLEDWERRELSRILPELAGPGAEAPALASEADNLHFKEATLNVVRRTSGGITAFVTDDMQYFDPASYDFGAFMMSAAFPLGQPGGLPHFIDTYRRGELDAGLEAGVRALVDAGVAVVIDLAPLPEADLDTLMDDLGVPEDPELRAGLRRYAGGNPLFLLETVRHLIETGGLERGLPEHLPPPGRVGPLLTRRLTRLSGLVLQAARAAAILQRDFDPELVAAVLGAPILDLLGAWEELEAAQIVEGSRFSHDLIAEAVLAGMPASVRTLLHRAAARTLAGREGHAARVAEHWLAGGAEGQAVPWLMRAAHSARATLRLLEAAGFYRRAADAASRAGDPGAAFAALAARAETLGHLEDRPAREEALREVVSAARTPLECARAWQLQSELHLAYHEGAETEAAARHGLEALEGTLRETSEVTEARANLEASVGSALWLQGHLPEAAGALRRAVAAQEGLGESPSLAANLANLAAVLDHLEQHREAAALHRRAGDLFERSGHLADLTDTLSNLSVCLLEQGDARGALGAGARAHELASRTDGDSGAAATTHANLGQTHHALAQYDLALRHFGLARAAARAGGWHGGYFAGLIAEVWLALGQRDRAGEELAGALAWPGLPGPYRSRLLTARGLLAGLRGEDPGEWFAEAEEALGANPRPLSQARVWLAYARFVPPDEGLSLARGACTLARANELGGLEIAALTRTSQVLLKLDRPAEAAREARAAVTLLERLEPSSLTRGEVLFTLGRALEAVGEEGAAPAFSRAALWAREVAGAHVPAEFRAGFLAQELLPVPLV